jgi:UPF0176 protein
MSDNVQRLNQLVTTADSDKPFVVCALYKFVSLTDYKELKPLFLNQLESEKIRGTILLAEEGLNGTIAGYQSSIINFLEWLESDPRFGEIDCKFSFHQQAPFHRCKVKLKKEIVSMGVDGIDPNREVGTYVDPAQWNELISDPDITLIDTRNEYEYQIGTFANAVNPSTDTFREFPNYIERNFDPQKHKKVAMFCTGGIRCEKASAYMKQQGFKEVFHLKGGILNYLEKVQQDETLWDGECFVFDDRVAVNHQLEKGRYDQCHACRFPITEEQKLSPHYTPGVSCPRCYTHLSEQQKQRFSEREKQMQLAKQRGEAHIGIEGRLAAETHKQQKQSLKSQQRKT